MNLEGLNERENTIFFLFYSLPLGTLFKFMFILGGFEQNKNK